MMSRAASLGHTVGDPVFTALFLLLWLLVWPVYHWTAGRAARSR